MKKGILITNNPMFKEFKSKSLQVKFREISALDIIVIVRDFLHKNYKLLTHPLHSSLKPNETPYRSIVISDKVGAMVDFESIQLIETAKASYEKFLNDKPVELRDEDILKDYQTIDCDLILKAME
ncbi:GrdX family protein [bacterium]|nr:GrdX family protein [bacterium]